MSCSARIGAFAAVSLVLLRLATGWHYFQEGTNKLNDPNWSSAGFLLQAKGPLADFYQSKVPQVHDWRQLLATPQYAGYIDEERIAKHREWEEAYAKEIAEAREAEQPEPFKISEYKPYSQWAQRIVDDWADTLEQFFELPDMSDEEKEQASAALDEARLELINYLEEVEPDISAYQHELFRIDQMRKQGSTGELAYHDERIQAKQNEATQMVQPWLAEITAIEDNYHADLRSIYQAGQEAREAARAEAEAADAASADAGETSDTVQAGGAEQSADGETADTRQPAANSDSTPDVASTRTTPESDPQSVREGAPPDPDAPARAGNDGERDSAEAAADPPDAAAQQASAQEAAEEPAEAEGDPSDTQDPVEAVREADTSGETAGEESATTDPEEARLTIDEVLTDEKEAQLAQVDKIVTWSHVIIGACLVVGLFTPLAALGGAVFLAMVISTQPPWVPGTQETYYQFVEMFSLLVLAATCAGRWAGLDYFFTLLFCRQRSSER